MQDLTVYYRIRTNGEEFRVQKRTIYTERKKIGKNKEETKELERWEELEFYLGAASAKTGFYRFPMIGAKTIFDTEADAVAAVKEAFGNCAVRVREWRTV